MDYVFLQIDIFMLLFRHYFDPFIAFKSQHSLFILGSYRSSDVWLLDSQFMAEMEESEAKICTVTQYEAQHNVT